LDMADTIRRLHSIDHHTQPPNQFISVGAKSVPVLWLQSLPRAQYGTAIAHIGRYASGRSAFAVNAVA
jgi:hypothetical protein